jgi:hypothetical protein
MERGSRFIRCGSFAAALRAGNPESIIAFNPGVKVPVIAYCDEEDYTAGEIDKVLPHEHPNRWINDEQYHILTYLGKWWGEGQPRFDTAFVREYTKQILSHEGVMSWDVGVTRKGLILPELVNVLHGLKNIRSEV